jgi:hypothetical protein
VHIYRSVTFGDPAGGQRDLTFAMFLDVVGRCALAAFSKHPWNTKLRSPRDKVGSTPCAVLLHPRHSRARQVFTFLERMGVTDVKEKKWQEKLLVRSLRRAVLVMC